MRAAVAVLEEDAPEFDPAQMEDIVKHMVGYAIASTDGNYTIKGIPSGTYQIVAFSVMGSETPTYETQTVTITEGEETVLDFENLE